MPGYCIEAAGRFRYQYLRLRPLDAMLRWKKLVTVGIVCIVYVTLVILLTVRNYYSVRIFLALLPFVAAQCLASRQPKQVRVKPLPRLA